MRSLAIQTVKGRIPVDGLGLILPHEHLFTDLRGPATNGYAQAEPEQVARIMTPFLEKAYEAGVTALAECSTVGVGRNLAVLQRLAEQTPIHIIAPTGVYRQAFIPDEWREVSAGRLAEIWTEELTEGISGTNVRAGFIKIAMSDEGPAPLEVRSLHAAAQASIVTGAVVASHTIGGDIAHREMDILERKGVDLQRFIWVHANAEANRNYHLEAARRGAYVELDAIGSSPEADEKILGDVLSLIEAGFIDHILLSHDAGWYDPSNPSGSGIRGYTSLVDSFLPALKAHGVSERDAHQITHTNPSKAFAL